MNPRPIAFLDSGVGGLPYLAHARKLLAGERFVYVADRENFPYGEKDGELIIRASLGVTARLMEKENPRLVVVACNTISVVALPALRARFSVPFVGVVPAIKPAAASSRGRRVGILATRQTVEGEYLARLIQSYASECLVVSLPASGLVEFVEREMFRSTEEERTRRVQQEVARFQDARIDTLVLGCTHFLHLEQEFRSLLALSGIALVDSRDGVIRQAVRLAGATTARGADVRGCAEGTQRAGASRSADGPGADAPGAADTLYVTGAGPRDERYEWFADRFGLRLDGGL